MESILIAALLLVSLLSGCDGRKPQLTPPTDTANLPTTSTPGKENPPGPPVLETFEGAPKLSLFPRIGDFRPAETDGERLSYWKTYLNHVTKTSGPLLIPAPQQQAGRVFALRSVANLDSVGFFSPLAVQPERTYEVSLMVQSELPQDGVFGIGVLEFDQFLWVGEQYTEELVQQHQTGIQHGLELRGQSPWQQRKFRFTTGPRTGMVHLVFYREGEEDRKPVLLDEIRIEPVPQ